MTDAYFPAGQWIGFYTYADKPGRYLMDLILEFRDGHIFGEGADGLGLFGIDGHYSPKKRSVLGLRPILGVIQSNIPDFVKRKAFGAPGSSAKPKEDSTSGRLAREYRFRYLRKRP